MSILDNAKEVAKAVHEYNNLDLYQRVLSLHSDIIELVEENNRLRKDKDELQKVVALKNEMTFKEPFYYRPGDDVPHCPACWEANQKAVHVMFVSNGDSYMHWKCPHCKHDCNVAKDRSVRFSNPTHQVTSDSDDSLGWMR